MTNEIFRHEHINMPMMVQVPHHEINRHNFVLNGDIIADNEAQEALCWQMGRNHRCIYRLQSPKFAANKFKEIHERRINTIVIEAQSENIITHYIASCDILTRSVGGQPR